MECRPILADTGSVAFVSLPSWIFAAEESWGEKDISTNGAGYRRGIEWGGGRERKILSLSPIPTAPQIQHGGTVNYLVLVR